MGEEKSVKIASKMNKIMQWEIALWGMGANGD
jgi:hypothetical protein